ncbi:MAG: NAD(P)/FAD-dependent oxidoreductase [Rhodospirillales bacterium]|jgi:L-2-hydroxyglutarate oxidase LhgO|nr:NAD(P)/FAD-dependent oxidoreductase [Rhodospirillales bacterium]HJO71559.1 NAD(P)/FAD-dependent oxidoreductase [Rhodospirillales bacterium]
MAESTDCLVIGAGVIGLAVARALSLAGREVVVLEAAEAIGTVMSSRNSEVIHAGIYYDKDSLKARLCVKGRDMLYAYCAERGIAHRRCGKLLVATEAAELAALEALQVRAAANGVDDLEWLDRGAARALEPALKARAALLSPSTGIVDSHAYMLSLQGDAESRGAVVSLNSPLKGGRAANGRMTVEVGGAEPMSLACRTLVNSTGIRAQQLAATLESVPAPTIPPLYLIKGNYFSLSGTAPFRRLVYPVPGAAGLGIHLTLDMAGQARFGPDVEPVAEANHDVDAGRAPSFYEAVRRYWPGLTDGALHPDYAGVRPRTRPPGESADFIIQGPREHGVEGLVNLYGIESPGLTSSLAIAEEVADLLS